MLKSFLVTDDSDDAGTVALTPGGLTLGRAADNDVPIHDSSVSAHHAKVVTYFEVSYIEDLGSTNGTYVNGRRIEKHTLHDGDEVWLGRCRMKFIRREADGAASPELAAEPGQAAG